MTALPVGPWTSGFDVQGHRGARGHRVENTWESFLHAAELGATTLEFDVRLTSDGQVVVWHDSVLDRCIAPGDDAGLRGRPVLDVSLAQLRSVRVGGAGPAGQADVRCGGRIMTLDELLIRMRTELPGIWAEIELKIDPHDPRTTAQRHLLVDGVVEQVAACGMSDSAIVHSFDWSVLRLAARAAPHLPRSALAAPENLLRGSAVLGGVDVSSGTRPWTRAGVVAGAVEVGAAALCLRYPWWGAPGRQNFTNDQVGESLDVSEDLVQLAHADGLAVMAWTVNEPQDIDAVLGAGVDGICSDYPERVVSRLNARGCAPASRRGVRS